MQEPSENGKKIFLIYCHLKIKIGKLLNPDVKNSYILEPNYLKEVGPIIKFKVLFFSLLNRVIHHLWKLCPAYMKSFIKIK